MKAAEIAKVLGGNKTDNGWVAPCPAHDDYTPSLSISVGGDGKVLFDCSAGCSQDQVTDALLSRGLESKRQNVEVTNGTS